MTTENSGIALDIDDTLALTLRHWIVLLTEKFGESENLTIEELTAKYRYAQHVPSWQSDEALEYMNYLRDSEETNEALPVDPYAVEAISTINKIIPVNAYLTVRPSAVSRGTSRWLQKHGFPDAPVVTRPDHIAHADGSKWKAEYLATAFPHIGGIIDDNPGLLQHLPSDYKGYVYLFGHNSITTTLKDHVIPCPDWNSVVRAIIENHTATTISR